VLDKRVSPAMLKALMAMSLYSSDDRLMIHADELAQHLGVSHQAVSKTMQDCARLGLIERVSSGRGATWRLCWIVRGGPQPGNGRHVTQPDVAEEAQPQVAEEPVTQPEVAETLAHAHAVVTPSSSSTTSLTVSRSSKEKTVTKPLDDEERMKLHRQFDPMFPHPSAVDETIEVALEHKASTKWKSEYGYLRTWLRTAGRQAREHAARMATEQARQERARTPYRPSVTEPTPLQFRNIRDIVGESASPVKDTYNDWQEAAS